MLRFLFGILVLACWLAPAPVSAQERAHRRDRVRSHRREPAPIVTASDQVPAPVVSYYTAPAPAPAVMHHAEPAPAPVVASNPSPPAPTEVTRRSHRAHRHRAGRSERGPVIVYGP
jgi:hypothetical protein